MLRVRCNMYQLLELRPQQLPSLAAVTVGAMPAAAKAVQMYSTSGLAGCNGGNTGLRGLLATLEDWSFVGCVGMCLPHMHHPRPRTHDGNAAERWTRTAQ